MMIWTRWTRISWQKRTSLKPNKKQSRGSPTARAAGKADGAREREREEERKEERKGEREGVRGRVKRPGGREERKGC